MDNQPHFPDPDWQRKEVEEGIKRFHVFAFIIVIFFLFIIFLCFAMPKKAHAQTMPVPALWQGLIAEDTRGDYQTYLAIASVVRNRITQGLNHGLVALKRKNLKEFIDKECDYALKAKGLNLINLSQRAISEVWQGKDYSNGATHYEHTGKYPTPYWAKRMRVAKVMFRWTKREITFYKR